MDNTTIAIIVSVVGSLITLLLMVNAFLLKMLVGEMSGMRVDLTIVSTQHDNTVGDVKENKTRILIIEQENVKVRERLHSLEGQSSQVLQYINDN